MLPRAMRTTGPRGRSPTAMLAEGAAFPVQYLTAYHCLITLAHAASGETVLIHAGAGGVGTAAVQIAKLLGLRVMVTASTSEKRAKIIELGADAAVGYDEFDVAAREFTGGRGPDICLESIGGDVFSRSLAIMPPFGRLVVYGAAGREAQPIDTLKLFFRSQSVLGLHLNGVFARPDLLLSSLTALLGWIDRQTQDSDRTHVSTERDSPGPRVDREPAKLRQDRFAAVIRQD